MHVNEHDKCRFDLVAIHLFCTRCCIDISTGTVTFKAKLVTETAAVEMKPVAFESRAPVVERVDQGRTPGYRQAFFVSPGSRLPFQALQTNSHQGRCRCDWWAHLSNFRKPWWPVNTRYGPRSGTIMKPLPGIQSMYPTLPSCSLGGQLGFGDGVDRKQNSSNVTNTCPPAREHHFPPNPKRYCL